MTQHDLIDALSVLCCDGDGSEYNQMPAPKRASYSSQRTSSRGSRSIESDTNSLFDSGYLSFGEHKPSIYLDLPDSAWQEHRRRLSRNLSKQHIGSDEAQTTLVSSDSPRQKDAHHQPCRLTKEFKEESLPTQGFLSQEPSRRHHSWSPKQPNKRGNNNLTTVHTMTGTIPLFERTGSNPNKNIPQAEPTRRSSPSFRYFTRKLAAIHDESAVRNQKQNHRLIMEHSIEKEYDFYANEAKVPKASQRPHRRAKSIFSPPGLLADANTGEASKSACKKAERSVMRDKDRNQVQQQAQAFLENCKIEHHGKRH